MHKYTDLEVYREAIKATVSVRNLLRSFPREERVTLGDQLLRAVNSVALNIAEGAGCDSRAEFGRFLTYSIRSAFECNACFDVALANRLIDELLSAQMHSQMDRLIAMLYGLQKYLRRIA